MSDLRPKRCGRAQRNLQQFGWHVLAGAPGRRADGGTAAGRWDSIALPCGAGCTRPACIACFLASMRSGIGVDNAGPARGRLVLCRRRCGAQPRDRHALVVSDPEAARRHPHQHAAPPQGGRGAGPASPAEPGASLPSPLTGDACSPHAAGFRRQRLARLKCAKRSRNADYRNLLRLRQLGSTMGRGLAGSATLRRAVDAHLPQLAETQRPARRGVHVRLRTGGNPDPSPQSLGGRCSRRRPAGPTSEWSSNSTASRAHGSDAQRAVDHQARHEAARPGLRRQALQLVPGVLQPPMRLSPT